MTNLFEWFNVVSVKGHNPLKHIQNFIFLAKQGEREAFMYNTRDFFKDFRFWYKSAKESERWDEYSYREGRLRGMNEMAYHIGLISFNTWEALETLLQKLTSATINK